MSKIQKLLERTRNSPNNVRFEDLDRLLTSYGFTCRDQKSGTSHFTFTKKGCPSILTVPRHRPVGETYVKRAIRAIDEYGEIGEQESEE